MTLTSQYHALTENIWFVKSIILWREVEMLSMLDGTMLDVSEHIDKQGRNLRASWAQLLLEVRAGFWPLRKNDAYIYLCFWPLILAINPEACMYV